MPWMYQDEIQAFLLDMFDIDVCRQTISLALQRIKITWKLRVEAAQRNQDLRTQLQDNLQEFIADQLVFLDESGSDDRTGDRQYGWSDEGVRAIVQRWLANRTRVSALLNILSKAISHLLLLKAPAPDRLLKTL
jgi:hypothetical protein